MTTRSVNRLAVASWAVIAAASVIIRLAIDEHRWHTIRRAA